MTNRPRIAITTGEPAGIGPDLCCALEARSNAELILIGDEKLLQDRSQLLGQPLAGAGIFNIDVAAPVVPGELNPANAHYVLDTINQAVAGCMNGYYDAMVTAPVHKGVINDAGVSFSGHTEFIADQLNADPVMVLCADNLKVALATTHLPLARVAAEINLSLIHI